MGFELGCEQVCCMSVFWRLQATALTTQPPRLVLTEVIVKTKFFLPYFNFSFIVWSYVLTLNCESHPTNLALKPKQLLLSSHSFLFVLISLYIVCPSISIYFSICICLSLSLLSFGPSSRSIWKLVINHFRLQTPPPLHLNPKMTPTNKG